MGLDAVEIVMSVEETFGIEISDADAESLQTPKQLIEFICQRIKSSDEASICISQRAFHRVRSSAIVTTGISRNVIKLGTRLSDIFEKPGRREKWKRFCDHLGVDGVSRLRFGGWFSSSLNFRYVVDRVIQDYAKNLPNITVWTNSEVREVTRLLIEEQTGMKGFSDDALFFRDLF